MRIDIANVEHGACAFIIPSSGERLALVDCGDNVSERWWPSLHFKYKLKRSVLEYLFITNADNDHYSDLHDLVAQVDIHWFYRNWQFNSEQFLRVKREGGPLSDDARAYNALLNSHVHEYAASPPFNEGMGGIACTRFANPYGVFTDTNNLSMAVFFNYGGFQILFPGDLQVEGWKELLKDAAFCRQLERTTVFVAAHHGRRDGYCEEVFDHCRPQLIVMSDKPIEHETQEGMAGIYANVVAGNGIYMGELQGWRKVFTTRNDGNIRIEADANAAYRVTTGVPYG